jgi:hypothetical protein
MHSKRDVLLPASGSTQEVPGSTWKYLEVVVVYLLLPCYFLVTSLLPSFLPYFLTYLLTYFTLLTYLLTYVLTYLLLLLLLLYFTYVLTYVLTYLPTYVLTYLLTSATFLVILDGRLVLEFGHTKTPGVVPAHLKCKGCRNNMFLPPKDYLSHSAFLGCKCELNFWQRCIVI